MFCTGNHSEFFRCKDDFRFIPQVPQPNFRWCGRPRFQWRVGLNQEDRRRLKNFRILELGIVASKNDSLRKDIRLLKFGIIMQKVTYKLSNRNHNHIGIGSPGANIKTRQLKKEEKPFHRRRQCTAGTWPSEVR